MCLEHTTRSVCVAAGMPLRSAWRLVVCAVLLAVLGGCATYSDTTEAARKLARVGDYDGAVVELDKLLKVDDIHAHPDKFGNETALVLLERGMLHQARADYEGARDDLLVADKQIELLDFTNSAGSDVAGYFYSDSTGPYRISPVERLSLNSMNILNFLAIGDLRGARVEAKRFTVIRKYLKDTNPDHAHGAIGSYLAGFVYEYLGEGNSAMRHYDDALEEGLFQSLVDPLGELSQQVSYRGRHIPDLLERESSNSVSGGGEILVVAGVGRVPYKVPKRMPIGAAIGIVALEVTEDLDVLERSAFKVLVYPELVPAEGMHRTARATIDGASVPMDEVTDIGAELVREYEEIKPLVITAAVTRMITRAIAAEGARAAAKQAGGDTGAVLGVLAGLATEGLLVAADKPDTRSWTLLPEKVFVSRERVPAGSHDVSVALGQAGLDLRTTTVDVPEGGFALVVVMPLF
ncbi:MAG: hypothetical protein ACI8W3_002750 [Myxococcota bacterium]|jgi:hypothetical protein